MTRKEVLNTNFEVLTLRGEKDYRAEIGLGGELFVKNGAVIDRLRGSIRGAGNAIHIAEGARLSEIQVSIVGEGNVVRIGHRVQLERSVIVIGGHNQYGNFKGNDNRIVIKPRSELLGVSIEFQGSKNALVAGVGVYAGKGCELVLNGFGCSIHIGDRTSMTNAFLHAEEIESAIEIGEDNMLADYVGAATGDKHPIYRVDNLQRTNSARNIVTGKHVWLSSGVQLLKGARVGDHCILGKHTTVAGCILAPDSDEPAHHAVVYGMPAQVQKIGVSWSREMFFNRSEEWANKYPDAAAQTWSHRGHLLVREGGEYLTQGLFDQAEVVFKQGVEAYQRAIGYKNDFVYAHSACGVAQVRLAEVALNRPDPVAAVSALQSARESFQIGLRFEPDHTDSLSNMAEVIRAMEALEKAETYNLGSWERSVAMARSHLQLFSIEWNLMNRHLAEKQLSQAGGYVGRIEQESDGLNEIIKELSDTRKRFAEWIADDFK